MGRTSKTIGPVFEALESRLLLSTVTWDGEAGTSYWSDPLNWSGNHVPGATDDVVITGSSAQAIEYSADAGDTQIASLLSSRPVTLEGGSLAVSGNVQVNNTFTLDGGALIGATVLAGTGGQGLSVTGNAANTLRGVTSKAQISVIDSADALALAGGLTLDGGQLRIGAGATVTVAETMIIGGTGPIVFSGTSTSSGTLAVAGGAALTIGSSVPTTATYARFGSLGGGSEHHKPRHPHRV
ncbi:MAG: hypothetical protein NTX87_16480 [Planctomycetota bacterium]|nr:hypothetical protein [Planctomycetota bacterium]